MLTQKTKPSLLKITLAACLSFAFVSTHAQTMITGWTFDNDGVGANASPAPSTGSGTATALGMNNSYNNTNSVSNPDIVSTTGGSTPTLPDAWRVRGAGTAPNAGNGWSSQAPIGTQGAEFDVSTVGFDNIQVSFDINTTAQAERNLQLEYTLDGTTWLNAILTSGGSLGTLENNTTSANTVTGSYIELASGWNTDITASISGAGNDANFGIRIVNASTGADDVNVSGSALNNTSGNWRYDNVGVAGTIATPEPSTMAFAGLGLAGAAAFRRMRKA